MIGSTAYILGTFFGMLIIIGISIPIAFWRARSKNEATARNHVQVCELSNTVDKKYYLCEEPLDGSLTIKFKKKDSSGKEIEQGKTFIAMQPHPGHYPPKGFKYVQAPISEYYVDDSFIPVIIGNVDPLEVASALFKMEHNGVISKIVHESHLDAEKEKKNEQPANTKMVLQLILFSSVLSVVVGGICIYTVMKGNVSITDILNGLRSLGIIS